MTAERVAIQVRLIRYEGLMPRRAGEKVDDLERRSRLVSLAYPVLAAIALPMDGAADGEVYSALAGAFHRKAAEAGEPSQRTRKNDGAPDRAAPVSSTGEDKLGPLASKQGERMRTRSPNRPLKCFGKSPALRPW